MSAEERQGAIDLAGEVNLQIREIGCSLGVTADSMEVLNFFCECGCLGVVALTPGAFDAAGGAWLDSHRPELRR